MQPHRRMHDGEYASTEVKLRVPCLRVWAPGIRGVKRALMGSISDLVTRHLCQPDPEVPPKRNSPREISVPAGSANGRDS
jgi:hypothetical protein